jgi:lysozyme
MKTEMWVDISWWQGNIDWLALKNEVAGVIIKASEANFKDKKFDEYRKAARRVGLKIQYYHFYREWVQGGVQALYFWSLIKDDPGDLPPVLDLESIGTAAPANVASSARAFVQTLQIASGKKPWIYTGAGFMQKLLAGCWTSSSRERRVGWMRDYPLWLAQYRWGYAKDFITNYLYYEALALNLASKPKAPFPWLDVAAWQWTGNGRVLGIHTSADVNTYYIEEAK